MTTSATAAIAYKAGSPLALEPVELAELQANEILVNVQACGICHTDTKFQQVLTLPGVFGHEGTGTVEEVGAGVSDIQPGDRVIMSYPFCNHCSPCLEAEPYKCEDIFALKFGGQRLDGSKTISLNGKGISSSFFQQSSFATKAICLEQAAVKIDSSLPPEMLAALPCGIQTGAGAVLNSFKVKPAEGVVIFGAGAVGLSAVMAARLCSANPIICIDMNETRLQLAKELGATHLFNAAEEELIRLVHEVAPRGVQYAFDSSASVPGLKNAISCIGQGGQVGIVSYPLGGDEFPFTTKDLFLKVGSLHGIFQGSSVPRLFLPKLIALQESGEFPYEKLITTYNFSDINQAFEDTHSGGVIKPVLLMNECR